MPNLPEIPYELQKAIKDDCLVVFAGSGTSIRLGLPNWKDLVLEILDKLKQHYPNYQPFEDLVKNDILSPLAILDYFEDHKDLIFEVLSDKLEIPELDEYPLHARILQLTKKVITTNYDRAFESANPRLNIIHNDGLYELAKILDRKQFLFKIHGDIHKLDNCTLFTNDYKKLYTEGAFLLGLKMLFIQKTILFVGFSLNDLYVKEIITSLNNLYNLYNRNHFIITSDGTFSEIQFNKKIKAINIGDFSNLDAFLDRLISVKPSVPQPNATDSTGDIKVPQYSKLIGRKKQLEEVMAKIRLPQAITVIHGLSGVGKTSLAKEIVRVFKGESDYKINNVVKIDFIVYVSLTDSGVDVLDFIFDKIGRETGVVKITQIKSGDKKQKSVDDLMKDVSVLLIIDNYELEHDERLDRWVQTVEPPSEVLLLSLVRPSFPHNDFQLDGLSEQDALEFLYAVAENRRVDLDPFKNNSNLKTIIETTNGNPHLMNIMIGLIRQGVLEPNDFGKINPDFDTIFDRLYAKSWSRLSDCSKTILSLFPLFAPHYTIDRNALIGITHLSRKEFDEAASQLNDWNLLHIEQGRQDEYTIHPSLNSFVRSKNLQEFSPVLVKESITSYYLKLAEDAIVRDQPNEVYWNSLVSPKMKSLESHWTVVLQAMRIASEIPSQKKQFLEFVLLLVHYMDSRFYNQERLEYVQKAIEVCKELKEKYLEALLTIDALGWTYVEEYDLKTAYKCIIRGKQIVGDFLTGVQADDLNSLAFAWLSRVKLEESLSLEAQECHKIKFQDTAAFKEAVEYITEAKKYKGKAWIQCRVYMAEGDILFKKEDYHGALNCFLRARDESDSYGGEGFNYQINPRIGFTYLGINELDKARESFTPLSENYEIIMGKLYGDYGLAWVKYKEGELKEARQRLNELERQICAKSNSHLLLRLIQQFKENHTDL
jgi:Cdc6-like AAA superfamily ATPase